MQPRVTLLLHAGALTLAQLAQALSLKVVIELHSLLSLLGDEGIMACNMVPRDLTVFWE